MKAVLGLTGLALLATTAAAFAAPGAGGLQKFAGSYSLVDSAVNSAGWNCPTHLSVTTSGDTVTLTDTDTSTSFQLSNQSGKDQTALLTDTSLYVKRSTLQMSEMFAGMPTSDSVNAQLLVTPSIPGIGPDLIYSFTQVNLLRPDNGVQSATCNYKKN